MSLLEIFSNTYVYYPYEKNEINFFEDKKSYFLRPGLCIFSPSSKNTKISIHHCSVNNNFVLKMLKRGMPKLYEYNMNQKHKKINSVNFNEILTQKISKFYDTTKIPKINIRKIKIKSQIFFQISYDKENIAWIISDSTKNCVIFRELTEVNTLFGEKKISKHLCKICEECYNLFTNNVKKKIENSSNKNINKDFFSELNQNTFLGFFLPDTEEIVFYGIVSNLPSNLEQFCLPITEVEDICLKFGLPYEKSITMKTDLVTFEQVEQELKLNYRRISEDYASFQSFGGIILIEHENEIITGFKILNQEMKIIKKIQSIKFNLNQKNQPHKKAKGKNQENIENEKYNKLMYEFSHYQLPRCVHTYLKLFSNMKIEDTLNNCLENLEDISKNIYLNCNCNKERSIINRYSVNLLSCLIPLDFIDNYEVNKNNDTNQSIATKENNISDKGSSLKSKTLNIKIKENNNNFNMFSLENINSTFMAQNCFMDSNQNVFKRKRTKKKVKFVDEVYNKNLVEEILIKSFKNYNMKNNFSNNKGTSTNCNVLRNTSCCYIF